MNRHLVSFFITSSLYILIVVAMLIYIPQSIKSIEPPIPKDSIIKVSIILEPTPEPKLEPQPEEPIVESKLEAIAKPEVISKPKPIFKPKEKPKKVVKKRVPKKVVKKKIVKKSSVKKRVIKKKSLKKSGHKGVASKGRVKSSQGIAIKKKFLRHIKSIIEKNKKYPKIALRRRIEGRVRVVFNIQKNGSVSNIRVSGANKILQKAVKDAIKRSFPVVVPSKLRATLPIKNISISIGFQIK